jgi:hypothetical protein
MGGAALMVCCTIHQGSTYLAILRILQKLHGCTIFVAQFEANNQEKGLPKMVLPM